MWDRFQATLPHKYFPRDSKYITYNIDKPNYYIYNYVTNFHHEDGLVSSITNKYI